MLAKIIRNPSPSKGHLATKALVVTLVLGTLILIELPMPLMASYQSGLEAYQQGKYQLAILAWQQVVESPPGTVPEEDRAEALYAIGMLYWLGQGVQQDTTESASWLRLAAELQHPGAQAKLAFLYSTGQGVRQSHFEALKWWQMAASQGDADAQYNLGVAFRDGIGVEPDANVALRWFREAAANGDYLSASAVENYEATGSLLTTDGTRITPRKDERQAPAPRTVARTETPLPKVSPVSEVKDSLDLRSEILREDWIRQRSPENYTIQVIALSQAGKLEEYIESHTDWAPFAIYAQTRFQQPIWVLVQGDYEDVEAARRVVREFPEDMQSRDKLWIRRFKMVQGLLE